MSGRSVVSDDEEEFEVQDDEREQEEDAEDLEDGDIGGDIGGDGGGGGGDDEDDDEEEEGLDEYEKDDFIVEDVDEDEDEDVGDDDEEERHKKKKRKKKEFKLDDEDLQLLEDANIPLPRGADKKFKRLKKARGVDDTRHSGFSDEDEFTGSRTHHVEDSLFDDGDQMEDIRDEYDHQEDDGDNVDEDDMADFIVDEIEVDDTGAPVRRQKVKKKKFGQASGVSSTAIQEAQEIFGDVEDLLNQRRVNLDKVRHDDPSERRLDEQFEPSVISENFMTEEDERIREIDIPERIQLSEKSIGFLPTDDDATKAEATWIRKQLKSAVVPVLANTSPLGEQEIEELEDHIINFLNFVHVQKLDIPFISMYRKEDISSLLKDREMVDDAKHDTPPLKWHKVLWAVHGLDKKWLLLQKRKSALLTHYNKRFEEESRRIYDETRLKLNRQLFVSILHMLEEAESEREVDDVDLKFTLHFPPGEAGVDEGKQKMPTRKSRYGVCNKAGLWEVASMFGCSSEQFGMQISLESTSVDEPEDRKETPEEVARNFTCAMFDTAQSVLEGARHMAAVEISSEPRVKKHFRSMYLNNAVVSTCPTTDGKTVIDAFHQFAGVKWLREKPLKKFDDAQWLLIQKAEEERLLQVTIKLPQKDLEKLETDSQEKYLSCGVSKSAQLWNEQRKMILKDAISNFILPALEKEARLLLTTRSKNRLLMEYGKRLWDKVSVAPYQRKGVEGEDDVAPRVMACCWGPGKPPTTVVMLDSFGEIVDVLEVGSITLRGRNPTDQQRKNHDMQNLLRFMTEHQPEAVVLGAVNLSCTKLKEDLYEVVYKMVDEMPRDISNEFGELSVVFGDESLPRLYENSHISSNQIPGQRGIVKRAVALGRYLQNPLAMVASLCGPEEEVLSWKLNPLESFLNADEKYKMVEQIMVDVTNQVGLDLNLAANHEWLFTPLQFISGLGPRKAASLQRSLARAGTITIRKDLLTNHGLGRKVFISAAGFLRVRRTGLAVSSSQFLDILDDTRIHPESYALAQEMAKDIYKAIINDDNFDEDDVEMAIDHLRDNRTKLKSFCVDHYARDTDRVNKMETLNTIKLELIQGFQDWRKKFEELSSDEAFYLISGETDDTLSEGRIVQVTVRRVLPQKAICSMESGLTGILNKEEYSDDWRDSDLSEKLSEGDVITCKVKTVEKNRYQVHLTCRDMDRRNNDPNLEKRDPYYFEEQGSVQSEQDKARKQKELALKRFKPRMIVHPRFQNITADEAMKFLADKDPGESIIRPSSRGPSYLTLTLKIYDGVFAHKDIIEGGKDHKDITSLLRIGKNLKIGDDNFEDLDEVMDRYIDPLVGHLKAMLNYRKFRTGTKAEVDEKLRDDKLKIPNMIAYCFGISHEHPGTFILTYIRGSNPHHEYIGLYPSGFKFRKRTFEDIDRLVQYFQRHINDPLHESLSIQSVAAMVPMRSPATGGFSAGADGGWRGSSERDHSSRGDRTGRNDYRNGGRDAHPSGVPRPYEGGRDRGDRGRPSYSRDRERDRDGHSDRHSHGGSKRGSDNKETNSKWSTFPGAKVDNAPGEEAFPGGWGGGGTPSGVRGWGDEPSNGGGGGDRVKSLWEGAGSRK